MSNPQSETKQNFKGPPPKVGPFYCSIPTIPQKKQIDLPTISVYIYEPNAKLPAMKQTLLISLSAAVVAIFSTSCQNSNGTADNPYGAPAAAPYQAPAANPYAAPTAGGETGSYNPNGAPYQPLPGLPAPSPSVDPPANSPYSPAPAPNYGGATASAGSHTVVSGDSLWGLARKYNTSVEAIQSANGLSDTVIRTGQTLTIPAQ